MLTASYSSISRRSHHVRQLLQDAAAHFDLSPHLHLQNHHSVVADATPATKYISASDVTDALERFTLWAGNLGALLAPNSRLSLDTRLNDAPETMDRVCEVLEDVAEAISELIQIFSKIEEKDKSAFNQDQDDPNEGHSIHPEASASDWEDNPFDEARSQLETISEYLRSLFRIAVLIRKSGRRDRFLQAIQSSHATFTDVVDISHLREKYPKLSEQLQRSLGDANAKRRQFIKYCRDHKTRLSTEGKDEFVPEANEAHPARTEFLSSKATTYALEVTPGLDFNTLDMNFEEDAALDDVISQISASTVSAANAKLTLPRLTKLSPDGEPFECPVCCTFQKFRHETAWRRHAFHDLKAYTCTAGCDEMFGDRNAWFQHELGQHRSHYICNLCTSPNLLTETDYQEHVRNTHGVFGDEQLQRLLDANRQPASIFRAQDCPFCDEWASALQNKLDPKGKQRQGRNDITVPASRFRRHVSMHQEQIAIFAVPREADDEDEAGSLRSGTFSSQSVSHSPLPPDSNGVDGLQADSVERHIQNSNTLSVRDPNVFEHDYIESLIDSRYNLSILSREARRFRKDGWCHPAKESEATTTVVEDSRLLRLNNKANSAAKRWGDGRWEEAETLQVHVVEGRRKHLGVDHPDTLTSMHNLAQIYIAQGRKEEASKILAEVIEVTITKSRSEIKDALAQVTSDRIDQQQGESGSSGQPHEPTSPAYNGYFEEMPLESLDGLARRPDGKYHCNDTESGPASCQVAFDTKTVLKEHLRGHLKPVLCPFVSVGTCNHRTAELHDMKRHIVSTHPRWAGLNDITSDDYYVCLLCGERFTRRDNLRRHNKKAHAKDVEV